MTAENVLSRIEEALLHGMIVVHSGAFLARAISDNANFTIRNVIGEQVFDLHPSTEGYYVRYEDGEDSYAFLYFYEHMFKPDQVELEDPFHDERQRFVCMEPKRLDDIMDEDTVNDETEEGTEGQD